MPPNKTVRTPKKANAPRKGSGSQAHKKPKTAVKMKRIVCNGKTYYVHPETKIPSWEYPSDLPNVYEDLRRKPDSDPVYMVRESWSYYPQYNERSLNKKWYAVIDEDQYNDIISPDPKSSHGVYRARGGDEEIKRKDGIISFKSKTPDGTRIEKYRFVTDPGKLPAPRTKKGGAD